MPRTVGHRAIYGDGQQRRKGEILYNRAAIRHNHAGDCVGRIAIGRGRHVVGVHRQVEEPIDATGIRDGGVNPRRDGGTTDGGARGSIRHGALQRASGSAGTRRELERANARLPASTAGRGIVLLGVPEGAVVRRVHRHHAIIAPTGSVVGLRATPSNEGLLSLGQRTRCVTGQAAGIPNRRIRCTTGNTVAQRHVAGNVHGNAAHPAVIGVRCIGALLVDAPTATAIAQFIPADAGAIAAVRIHGVIDHQRLVAAEAPS